MKYRSIASVISKSAMTPSFSGRIATMFPGVLPSISFAVSPTARPSRRTLFVPFLTATTLGSLRTIPFPCTHTSVLAVPRSIPMSIENLPRTHSRRFAMLRPRSPSGVRPAPARRSSRARGAGRGGRIRQPADASGSRGSRCRNASEFAACNGIRALAALALERRRGRPRLRREPGERARPAWKRKRPAAPVGAAGREGAARRLRHRRGGALAAEHAGVVLVLRGLRDHHEGDDEHDGRDDDEGVAEPVGL